MSEIKCPRCETLIEESQLNLKITKDQRYLKVRCPVCRHAWKVPSQDFSKKPDAQLPQ